MKPDEALAQRFHCPKCHAKRCNVSRAHLPHGVIPLPTGHYLAATCALCGYTEFYSQAVFEASLEPLNHSTPMPEPAGGA